MFYTFFSEPVAVVNDTNADIHDTNDENYDTKAEHLDTKTENLPSTSGGTTDTVVKPNTQNNNKAAPKTNKSNGFGGMKKGFLL